MFNKRIVEEVLENIEKKENENRIPKNLVEVRFEDGFTLSYFSDLPEIKVGDVVSAGQVVCIVEAMKLMNEIESEVSGKIVQICVEDGQSVEYGQVLMYVE